MLQLVVLVVTLFYNASGERKIVDLSHSLNSKTHRWPTSKSLKSSSKMLLFYGIRLYLAANLNELKSFFWQAIAKSDANQPSILKLPLKIGTRLSQLWQWLLGCGSFVFPKCQQAITEANISHVWQLIDKDFLVWRQSVIILVNIDSSSTLGNVVAIFYCLAWFVKCTFIT